MEHMIQKKRVACLYRVSTKAQVDKITDDIPMQVIACGDFIKQHPGWTLVKEYKELGVSGYKKTAAERDELQQLKKDAEAGVFDVLLVFMFDRLGRREDETPFIIEWLVLRGIEVWSVKEGQQTFESRVDKLLNYIRYWQSGGESEKTGIRVYEKHSQMIKDGTFCGGIAPYGYRLIPSTRLSNKGRQLKEMVIDEEESKIVRLIYSLAVDLGMGGQRIALYLNEHAIPTRKGSKWGLSVINYMLRNPIYKGYPTYGKTTAKTGANKRLNPEQWLISAVKIEHLAIIQETMWEAAQRIREARTPDRFKTKNIDYSQYPLQTKSKLLLTGKIRCGHCGSTLCSYESVSRWRTNGQEHRSVKPSYRCISVNRGINCQGQKTYTQERVEAPVLEEIYTYLDMLETIDLTAEMKNIRRQALQEHEKELKAIRRSIQNVQTEITTLNTEIVNAISGNSHFSPEQLSAAISQKNTELEGLSTRERSVNEAIATKDSELQRFLNLQKLVPSWREEFANAPAEVKKMLISELIDSVVVYRDSIEIHFRVALSEFLGERE